MSDSVPEYRAGFIMGQLTASEFLRERLATEIEQSCKGIVPQYFPCSHCQTAADIVRGAV